MKRVLALLLAAAILCPTCIAKETLGVSAASAILMDAASGRVLYEKDAHSHRLIASTTKLMTALVAVEAEEDLQRVVTVKPEHQAEGSSMYLRPGEKITLEALLYGLLLSSGNDAALAIAESCAGSVETFVRWMNDKAAELGMADTHFVNPNGLDHEAHYSTAYDLALLGRAVLTNAVTAQLVSTRSISIAGRSLTNHNKLLWRYEGCTGMKTGYTEAAGRTLVSSAERDGQTLICVTLKAPDDWDDHVRLFDYGFSAYQETLLARAGKGVRYLPVRGSLIPQVEVIVANDVWYPLAQDERITARLELPEWGEAPIHAGDCAGWLVFLINGEPVGESELCYVGDIPATPVRLGFFDRIRQSLTGAGRGSPA